MKKKIFITFILLVLTLGMSYFVSTKVQAINAMGTEVIDGEIVYIDEEQGVVDIRNIDPPNDEKRFYAHPEKLELFNEGNRVRAYYKIKGSVIRNMERY